MLSPSLRASPRPGRTPARRSTSRPGGEAGFTLVELTVSMLLMVLLALVMATYYPNASNSGAFSRDLTFATLLAQQQMEEIKTKTFTFVTPTNFATAATSTQWGIAFTRSVTITMCNATTTAPCPNPITSTQSPNLAIVSVTVSWQEQYRNLPNAVTLTTVVQNYF